MNKHHTHRMHANSLDAHAKFKSDRYAAIIQALRQSRCPLTDREVLERVHAKHPGIFELSQVQPRLSDLVKAGIVQECGYIPGIHGRMVRVCRLTKKGKK